LVFSGGVGSVFNQNKLESELPTSALKAYPDLDVNHSHLDRIESPSKRTASIHYHANVGYYFGKTSNKTKGISVGVSFSHYSADYNVGGLTIFYRNTQPGSGDGFYHQIDSLSTAAVEEVDFSLLNFPLMFRYKTKFSQKMAVELAAGPSLFLLSASSKLHNGAVDYGMIYEYDQSGNNKYTNGGYRASATDWVVTRAYLLSQGQGTAQAADYADNLFSKGYNVGLNQPVTRTESIKSRSSLGLNATVDLFYHLGPKTAVKLGVNYVQSTTKGKNNNYRMVDSRSDNIKYTSVVASDIESKYTAFGFSVGLIIGLY
jgi:hypothetical protein